MTSTAVDEAGLAEARAAARRRAASGGTAVERPGTITGGIEWRGLRFEPLAATFGIADPSPAELGQLTACREHYRTNLPPDVKIAVYGNRVGVEPGVFGARLGADQHARRVPGRVPCPMIRKSWWGHRSGAWITHEQFRRARALPVPDGFIRIVREPTGFEEDGSIGAIYLVLKDRWDVDRPC